MPGPTVDVNESPKSYSVNQTVVLTEGDTSITIALPQSVPAGKKVTLVVEVRGQEEDAE